MTHYGVYVEFSGYYPFCRVDRPELDHLPASLTKQVRRVTCNKCHKRMREVKRELKRARGLIKSHRSTASNDGKATT